jgi:hypothetical protein
MVFSHKKVNGNGTVNAIEAELKTLMERRFTLADKLADARAEASASISSRRSWLLGPDADDDKARKAVDDRVIRAQAAEVGLSDALEALDTQIEDAKQRLTAERDQQERESLQRTPHTGPGVASASQIRFPSAGATGGRPRRLPPPFTRSPRRSASAPLPGRTGRRSYCPLTTESRSSYFCPLRLF